MSVTQSWQRFSKPRTTARARLSYKRGGQSRLASALAHFNSPGKRKWERIWVDKDGDPVAPPTPTWHAVGDAYGIALAILMFVGVTMTSFVTGVRSRLDRARVAQWDREIRCLQEDGGRTNQH